MKIINILLVTLIYSSSSLYSQSIIELYKQLSIKVTELNTQQQDILLQKKMYILPDSDSISTEVCSIDTIDNINNYLSISYEYTTGQAGWKRFEFRLFNSQSRKLLVISKTEGVRISRQQNDFIIFEVDKGNSLKRIKNSWTIDNLEFFETETTKDFLTANWDTFCFTYSLDPAEFPNGIAFIANPCYIIDDRISKVQKKNTIRINWNGQSFEKEKN